MNAESNTGSPRNHKKFPFPYTDYDNRRQDSILINRDHGAGYPKPKILLKNRTSEFVTVILLQPCSIFSCIYEYGIKNGFFKNKEEIS